LFSNYFPFAISPDCQIFQYAITFEPPLEASRMRARIIYNRKELGSAVACDGQVLYTPRRVPDQDWQVETSEGRVVAVNVRLVKEWRASDEVPYQLCNILMKRLFREMRLVMIGRSFYDPTHKIPLPQHSIEVWPGVITSVVPVQSGSTQLICDVSHRAVRLDNILDAINNVYSRVCRGPGVAPSVWQAAADAEIAKSIVLTRYNNSTYRIDRIDWSKTPADTFDWEGHGQTTFAEYVLRVYNKKVTNMRQPLLVTTRRQRTLYLIPEFCSRTGLTEEMRKDWRVMADLATHTRPDPRRRAADVTTMVNRLATDTACKKQLDLWGMRITPTIQAVGGSVMPTPTIGFRQGATAPATDGDWTRSLQRNQVANSGPQISAWGVIYPGNAAADAQNLAGMLQQTGRRIGIMLGTPVPLAVTNPSYGMYMQVLKVAASKQLQFVLCIVAGENKELYNAIKQQTAVEMAIPSQVMRLKMLQHKHLDTVVMKIVLQICCKIGGELWTMQHPPETRDAMIIGIDVCHATPIGSSVAGFVATTNPTFSRYCSSVTFQPRGQEIITNISDFVVKAIGEYRKKNGRTPRTVIVYRDGVGDGQLEYVLREEVPQLKEGFAKADKLAMPRLVFVVVKKRIHTRLFACGAAPGSFSNPPPGTVCDQTIMHRDWYDFFLVSQAVTQGTVAPTHFHVIEDQVGMPPQVLQNFTFQLCHLYYNWSGTVRVPAPCQYAHKLAFLVGQNIQRPPSELLSDKLYFL